MRLSHRTYNYYESDWLVHDPIAIMTPDLKIYQDAKEALYKKGVTVFPEGTEQLVQNLHKSV